ncbi:YfbR-like 5'-deoxynucleotidase [Desulfogranum mediterraneum]|uniref:YfbR-like 5'-deoxynucleotidase n=1 Tax=Desulfogranum mediterraneum TaxID=160661 RepID=UPI00040037CE|nr:YfbR-like 5'-deoxynucleotidase [Desulfogranum mediterraneum]
MEWNRTMTLPKLTLADLARSGHVTRWHSVRTSRDQTLAEHHYMVTRISNKLAKEIFASALTDRGLLQIMEYASLHDTPELLMGDLPSPLKRHLEQLCGEDNPLEAIEDAIAPWLRQMKEDMRREHPEYLLVVKLADIIDALVFITEEGIGSHAARVIAILEEMLRDKLSQARSSYPHYDWSYTQALLRQLLHQGEASKLAFEEPVGEDTSSSMGAPGAGS